jgi:cysteine desulfurase / selenocysteine lyase
MISPLFDRRHFPTLERYRYLNQASLGLIGNPAVQAMHRFIDDYARHGNSEMSDEDEACFLDTLRGVAARLFSCPAEQVAVVGCASEILAQLPLMIPLPRDGTVIVVKTDFPAVTRPWLREEAMGRARIRFVEDRPSQSLTDALIDAIDANTAVVAVSSVQYSTGTTVDVARLGKAVSEAGARLVVDVTQDLGARRIDSADWNADAVVCSGYKWLGGHGGVALAMMSPRLLEQPPPMTGWMGAPDPFDFDATKLALADDARRYTQSTMSYASVACLTAAVEQLLDAGAPSIESHAEKLAAALSAQTGRSGWTPFRTPAGPDGCAHIVALSHPDRSAAEARALLADRGIVCSARGGRVRVSIAPYNDESDIDAVAQALSP